MTATLSKWTVGVMGSSAHAHDDDAADIGKLLAFLEVNLLTGGGRGVMRAVAQSFLIHRRGPGISIGILPCADEHNRATPRPGYPNPFVELPIQTHLFQTGEQGMDDLSRNHINILSCHAVIALPGGSGTISELNLAARYRKPVVAYSRNLSHLDRFPTTVPRSDDIKHVERLVRGFLGA
jgi:uncharacterized protein (TIGR00725 family)